VERLKDALATDSVVLFRHPGFAINGLDLISILFGVNQLS
jgi:hypothetical protein